MAYKADGTTLTTISDVSVGSEKFGDGFSTIYQTSGDLWNPITGSTDFDGEERKEYLERLWMTHRHKMVSGSSSDAQYWFGQFVTSPQPPVQPSHFFLAVVRVAKLRENRDQGVEWVGYWGSPNDMQEKLVSQGDKWSEGTHARWAFYTAACDVDHTAQWKVIELRGSLSFLLH